MIKHALNCWPRISGGCASVALALMLAACSAGQAPSSTISAGLNCIDDSPNCIRLRQSALSSLMADRQRTWIHTGASPEAYASGVRMFGFKNSKKQLTCIELTAGIQEASAARGSLKSKPHRFTTAQVARGAMLGDEVARELTREKNRRCKKG